MNDNKFLFNKDPWMLAEDIPDIDFQFSQIWLSSFVNDLEITVGRNYKKIICIYHGLNLKFYYGREDAKDFAEQVLNLIIKNPAFGRAINYHICLYADKLKARAEEIESAKLKKMANQELARFYRDLDKLHTTLYTWGWLPNAVDMFHGNFTAYLKKLLGAKLVEDKINEAMVILSTDEEKSILQQEHESFLKLINLKQKKATFEEFKKEFNRHLNKYFYLKHLWLGKQGVYDEKYYLEEIKKFIKSGESAGRLLKKEQRIFKEALQARKKLIKQLGLSQKQKEIIDVYAKFSVTKLYRRDAQIYWAYKMDYIFAELARRLKITFVEARWLFPDEVIGSLKSGKIAAALKRELKSRQKFCVYYATKNYHKMYYGQKAREIEKKIDKLNKPVKAKEFTGQTASLGQARGYVKIINEPGDMKKMKTGDILVSIATNPDIVPAMKKAAAIITEQGGITSHAAIVSRELGVPCVIGTKIATKVLRDGDLVEVDADRGIVRKL